MFNFRNIGSAMTKFRNHPNGKEKHLNFGTKNMLSTLEITLSTTRLFLWPSSKRKCLKITQKVSICYNVSKDIWIFARKKTYTFIGEIRANFFFSNLHGVFFLRNIFWVVYSIFWFSLLLRCFSPFIFCCNSIKKGLLFIQYL